VRFISDEVVQKRETVEGGVAVTDDFKRGGHSGVKWGGGGSGSEWCEERGPGVTIGRCGEHAVSRERRQQVTQWRGQCDRGGGVGIDVWALWHLK
jgi:hypothetical protein